MSENTNNGFYKKVETSSGVEKNFINNIEDAREIHNIAENEGNKAAREAELEMSSTPVSVLIDKIKQLYSSKKEDSFKDQETIDRLCDRNNEKDKELSVAKIDITQNNTIYDDSLSAISEVLSPSSYSEEDKKMIKKPNVPFTFTRETIKRNIPDEKGNIQEINDVSSVFSSIFFIDGEKTATLSLKVNKFGEKEGDTKTIKLECKDNKGEHLNGRSYSVVQSEKAASDFI